MENKETINLEEQRTTADFSSKAKQARRQWSNVFKVMKEKAVNLEIYS